MPHFKIARISPESLAAIQELEQRLGEDICLLAVQKADDSRYRLEAKVSPNQWEPVDQVYPQIDGLKSEYSDPEAAHHAKAGLKSLLNSTRSYRAIKKPIRIKKIA